MATAVFVYGTLMPGHLRWELLAAHATATRSARVGGHLYDTGRGWPAARFHTPVHAAPLRGPGGPVPSPVHSGLPETRSIPGWVVTIDRARERQVLRVLDDVEAAVVDHPDEPPGTTPPGRVFEYRRVVVRTDDGDDVWAYEALTVRPHWTPIDAWEGRSER